MPNAIIERAARHHVQHLRALGDSSPDALLSPDAFTLAPLMAAHARAVADLLEYYLDVEGGVDGIWAVRYLLKSTALGLPGGELWQPEVTREGLERLPARIGELAEVIAFEETFGVPAAEPEPTPARVPTRPVPVLEDVDDLTRIIPIIAAKRDTSPVALLEPSEAFNETDMRLADQGVSREAWAPRLVTEADIPNGPSIIPSAPATRAELRAQRKKRAKA